MTEASPTPPRMTPMIRWGIWSAMFASLFIYYRILQSGAFDSDADRPQSGLVRILSIAGLVSVFLGLGVKYFVGALRDDAGNRKIPTWIDHAFIVCLALVEVLAIFGLFLGLQGEALSDSLPLFVMSAVGMVLVSPKWFFPDEPKQRVGRS